MVSTQSHAITRPEVAHLAVGSDVHWPEHDISTPEKGSSLRVLFVAGLNSLETGPQRRLFPKEFFPARQRPRSVADSDAESSPNSDAAHDGDSAKSSACLTVRSDRTRTELHQAFKNPFAGILGAPLCRVTQDDKTALSELILKDLKQKQLALFYDSGLTFSSGKSRGTLQYGKEVLSATSFASKWTTEDLVEVGDAVIAALERTGWVVFVGVTRREAEGGESECFQCKWTLDYTFTSENVVASMPENASRYTAEKAEEADEELPEVSSVDDLPSDESGDCEDVPKMTPLQRSLLEAFRVGSRWRVISN